MLADSLVQLVKKHECHSNYVQLAGECADHLIEAYDVLVALYEASTCGYSHDDDRRKKVEEMAKHLISRFDMASKVAATTELQLLSPPSLKYSDETKHHPSAYLPHPLSWDESSNYSHTAR